MTVADSMDWRDRMASEAQKRATARYQKANVKSKLIKFFPKDHDLAEWYEKQPSKNAYIMALIRKDFENRR